MANELHTFTGNEVIATELPELLNQNFDYVRENSLKSVNGVEKDENNNVDVTFLTSQVIPTNSDLNNFRESGEYTRELDTVVVTNSPTEKPFFLTVLASENLVKQVVTEIDLVDPITFTRTLSGANWSPWVEGGKVKSIMGLKANDEGDVDLTPLDYPTRYELGIWKSAEEVSVGDVRFLEGRENVGYVLECVANGITGEEQPTVVVDELANYSSVGRIGQVRVIFNLAEKDVDEVMAMGITYSRLTYPELWEWAGKRAGLVISEEEWQAKFAETNGKFVPYYSSGDGSGTFRTPLLGAYLKGAEVADDVGKWMDAGLPNIDGVFSIKLTEGKLRPVIDSTGGAFYAEGVYGSTFKNMEVDAVNSGTHALHMDASRSSSIYGNSDTVTPETMTGVWVIKAVGVVVDSGETDIANVLTATEQVQERVSIVEDNHKIKTFTSLAQLGLDNNASETDVGEVIPNGCILKTTIIRTTYPNFILEPKGQDFDLVVIGGDRTIFYAQRTDGGNCVASYRKWNKEFVAWEKIAYNKALSMPSSNFISITPVHTPDAWWEYYTAPAAGYFIMKSTRCKVLSILVDGIQSDSRDAQNGLSERGIFVPVKAGSTVSYAWDEGTDGNTPVVRFYYAQSEV